MAKSLYFYINSPNFTVKNRFSQPNSLSFRPYASKGLEKSYLTKFFSLGCASARQIEWFQTIISLTSEQPYQRPGLIERFEQFSPELLGREWTIVSYHITCLGEV